MPEPLTIEQIREDLQWSLDTYGPDYVFVRADVIEAVLDLLPKPLTREQQERAAYVFALDSEVE